MQVETIALHRLPYPCALLNIIEKGPMVSYGVPGHDP